MIGLLLQKNLLGGSFLCLSEQTEPPAEGIIAGVAGRFA